MRAPRLLGILAGIAAGWTAAAAPALAQGGGSAPGAFDFYVLALSWPQCEPGRRLGFVVHGLWPQYERGFPSECGGGRFLPRTALDQASDL